MAIDARMMGQRIAEARGRAGLTQAQLASAVSLDRSALAKIETGSRRVSALELASLAESLDVRIEWFVQDAPEAIISRRNTQESGTPSPRIDATVERVARAVEFTLKHDQRFILPGHQPQPMVANTQEAEALAEETRSLIGVDRDAPCTHLAERLASLGLLVFSVNLGVESADAATILLRSGGIAVINGDLRVGRRRLALAHELGHYIIADDYSVDWRVAEYQDADRRESLFDRFARALLLPEAGLRAEWNAHVSGECGSMRTAAVCTASAYRVDMATLARRLLELDVINSWDAGKIRSIRTTRADIVELGLVVGEELVPPTLPREYELSVLRLYRSETISTARALDLLLDTWDGDMLPDLPDRTEDEIWQYV
jgi:Zn-dependent peptidase ImmA (M78 family)/transcriptional regulator with XRE-family HTH domain